MENINTDQLIGLWNYNSGIPIVKSQLQQPGSSNQFALTFIVDSGYDGEILVANDWFLDHNFDRFLLPASQWSVGTSISGHELQLQATLTLLTIGDQKIQVRVETATGVNEHIIGRGLLDLFICVFNGPRQQLSIYRG